MTRVQAIFLLAALLCIASGAHAQGLPEDHAAADALYEESGVLMKAGRFADACPKLETSQRLDPGVGTLLRLGYCYEHVGRTASAWAAYNDAVAMARKANDRRADEAAGRAKAVEPRLSRLAIVPVRVVPGLEIRRDGTPLDQGLWGIAVPVDPGEHSLEARAPGWRTWATRVTTADAGTTKAEVPALAPATSEAAPKSAPFWGAQRIAGAVVGAVGLVAIGVSLGYGASAKTSNVESLPHCLANDPTQCYAPGVSLRNSALSSADVATGIFVGGAAALTAGLITFFVPAGTPAARTGLLRFQVRPGLGVGSGSLNVGGAW
jgi:hypothetical protein